VHEAPGILAVRVTTHGWLVHGDFAAAGCYERKQLFLDDGEQRLRQRVAVGIMLARDQPATQGVRSGNAGLQNRAARRKPPQSFEFLDNAQAARGRELARDLMPSALVVGRRPEAAWRRAFQFEAFKVAV